FRRFGKKWPSKTKGTEISLPSLLQRTPPWGFSSGCSTNTPASWSFSLILKTKHGWIKPSATSREFCPREYGRREENGSEKNGSGRSFQVSSISNIRTRNSQTIARGSESIPSRIFLAHCFSRQLDS